MAAEMGKAEERLRAVLTRVFADGVLEDQERAELRELYTRGGLTVPLVKSIFTDFVKAAYAQVMSDGVVTKSEQAKLRAIVEGLRLPAGSVPDEVSRVLNDDFPVVDS